ncbi:MAG: type II toxin-antitoxin system RelE/ParE family toxin [Prevotellaceae bacterium]|jgi:plasmid stabilization system protein ParE|nr:type II toxin-antitoxin system RelE/ParE family toxin [Prevotellaceae bacterium]
MRVIISEAVERQINIVFEYGTQTFGKRTAERLRKSIYLQIKRLTEHPRIGHREFLLEGHVVVYRSLVVHKHYKVIYHIDEEKQILYIVALWDTRRNPASLVHAVITQHNK